VFRDLDLWHGHQAPWGPQAVVITQGADGQCTAAELTPQVPLHTGQLIRLGGDMEGIDHHLGGLIRRQGRQELAPQLTPAVCWQQVVLQLSAQQRPGLTAQAFDHVAEVDAPQRLLPFLRMQPQQCFDVVTAQVEVQAVMAQVHRQLLADQP
jgi:hypothetical protein